MKGLWVNNVALKLKLVPNISLQNLKGCRIDSLYFGLDHGSVHTKPHLTQAVNVLSPVNNPAFNIHVH